MLPADLAAKGNVLARYDSGDPAWVSFSVGKGTLHVLTTTWRPADSQFALTTKFPPLLHALLSQAMIETGGRGPVPAEPGHFTVEHTHWVVMNLPPARVWLYRRIG